MPGRRDHRALVRGDHHSQIIEEGVFRSYLPVQPEEDMLHFLDQYPDALTPDDLPDGTQKRRIQRIFDDHIFIGDNSPGPTVERILSLGTKTPPSLVELSIATAVLYHGVRHKCVLSAHDSQHWTDSYELDPREVANALLLLDWTCAGFVDNTTLPAVKYIARLSTSLGLKLVLPRETWLQEDLLFRPAIHWAAFLPFRTHIPPADLFWDLRTYAGNLESLSFWMLDRPLSFVGPGTRLLTTVLDCFLLTLTTMRASANAFGLAHVSGTSFFEGLAASPGVVSIAQSDSDTRDRSISGSDTRASNRDGDRSTTWCRSDPATPSSSDCEAE